MLIDTHQHVFWHGRDDAGLIADLDEHGIDRAWLLTWEIAPAEDDPAYHSVLNPCHLRADGTHAGIPLSDLVITRDRYPGRFEVGYCPNPLLGDAAALFEAAHRVHGVRVCGEWKFRVLFDDPRCINLFRKAGELSCPVVLHLDAPFLPSADDGKPVYQPSWYGGTIDNLARALEACPDTVFIGHAPGFWRYLGGNAEQDPAVYPDGPVQPGGQIGTLFDRYPNLYADLSAGSGLGALRRDPEHAKAFLTRYAVRLLFARDYYGGDLGAFLSSIELAEDVKEKLYFKNALRLVPDQSMHA